MLRPGNAGSNTAADHIEATRLALAQLPRRPRRRVLIRTDSGGGTHDFLTWLASPGRRLHYSVGMTITADIHDAILHRPGADLEPAYDAGRRGAAGAWVAELTGLLDLAGWPEGMRVIVRKERPHPGAQLRFTDIDGHRFTCLRHQRPGAASSPTWNCATAAGPDARTGSAAPKTPACATSRCTASPRTRSGARSSPWPASSSPGWQMLALDGPARAWEPKRLRLRLFSAAGRLVRGGRRLRLRLAATWPWASQLTAAITRLQAYAPG